MGLGSGSVGIKAIDKGLVIKKQNENDKIIALAGSPNVGKSTVFNALTGLKQHTGNWAGKTVMNAQGYFKSNANSYVMIDIPGTYSLMAHSAEEEVARNFICFGGADAVVVVCDATRLEQNLNLVLQTMEISDNVIVCVNLLDEAKRKGFEIDITALSCELGVRVAGTVARKKHDLDNLINALDASCKKVKKFKKCIIEYPADVENSIALIEAALKDVVPSDKINRRWLSLRLLENDRSLIEEAEKFLDVSFSCSENLRIAIETAKMNLEINGITADKLKDIIVSSIVRVSERVSRQAVKVKRVASADRKIDRVLTSRRFGYPLMFLLLLTVFWITIVGANYPSEALSNGLFYVQDRLTELFTAMNAPDWLHGVLVLGVYRVLAWVVSVMLPPMAIFFPLFTLLEDVGYLPRVAYNLDRPFRKCHACGKQALCMCMGFGCNAAGIVGARIIDSPRERLLAIITNNFVPCNGRFPSIIAIIGIFFVTGASGLFTSVASAAALTLVIALGIAMTFAATKLLSKTILKGVPSSYTLELPSYRKPQVLKVITRSILDRTLFVLGRAVVVAIPAGLIIWLTANTMIDGTSLLTHCANFLNPFAELMGLNGVILIAFILGFPANEIVVPIIIMAYLSNGSILELESIDEMRTLFVDNGWTWITAVNFILFSLMHWPCSTTLITIKKETGSAKWTLISALVPTAFGVASCMIFTAIARLFV